MTIKKYIIYKFFRSFLISSMFSFSIFYIFSLLANLNESYSFSSILYLTLLNTLQIFIYVPSYMMILTLAIFIIFLRTNNEFIILKEYLKISSFLILITPIILFFSIIEMNKNMILNKVKNLQSQLIDSENLENLDIFIEKDKNKKFYTILKKLDKKNDEIFEYFRIEIFSNSIVSGEYSESVTIRDNDVSLYNLIIFDNKNFIQNDLETNVLKNLNTFSNKLGSDINKNDIKISYEKVNKFVFYILFYYIISLTFFSKKLIIRDMNQISLLLFILCLFFYVILIPTISLSFFNSYFHIIATIIFLVTFVKIVKYE